MNASRGAAHERNAEPLLQPAQRLTHRRATYSEPLACGAEALRLSDRDEYFDPVELVTHCSTSSPSAGPFGERRTSYGKKRNSVHSRSVASRKHADARPHRGAKQSKAESMSK